MTKHVEETRCGLVREDFFGPDDTEVCADGGTYYDHPPASGEITVPGQYRFDYLFADDANTTIPELRERHGQVVTVLSEAENYDRETTGPMYAVKFEDGYTNDVFEEELHSLT